MGLNDASKGEQDRSRSKELKREQNKTKQNTLIDVMDKAETVFMFYKAGNQSGKTFLKGNKLTIERPELLW